MTRTNFIIITIIITIAVLFTWNFYSRSIDISTKNEIIPLPQENIEKPIKYFGVVSRYTPREIFLGYQPIMDYLTENTPYKFELKLNASYEGTARQLADGEISIASLGSLVFATLEDEYNLEVILKPLNQNGNDYYHSIFITQDTSTINNLTDLKNRSLLLPSQESLTGRWMPIYIYEEVGLDNKNIQIEYTSHHTTVAEQVLQGNADAGVVKEAVAEIFKERGLRVFHIAPKRTTIPIVISDHTEDELKRSVIEALLNIDIEDPVTQEMLKSWDEELSYGFALTIVDDYKVVKGLLPKLKIQK